MSYNLYDILIKAHEEKASDIHFTVAKPPILRIRGDLVSFGENELTQEDTEKIANELMSDEKKAIFNEKGEVDFSWSVPSTSRYRVNIYRQRGSHTAALRLINTRIPTTDELRLPEILNTMALKPRGMFLVTGPTGSGKSTTLAAMVGHINKIRKCHVLTIEDPIEYMHKHDKCMVNQREVGTDTMSFSNALRASLREDPDVIMVGEMSDYETISTAISAAETGHYVLSTLHTTTSALTVDRIIDTFPPHQQQQVKTQLASILQGIICQQLIKSADGKMVVPAVEILIVNDAVRNLIREGKNHQIDTVLQTSIKQGMMPMDYSLAQLVKAKIIRREDAQVRCVDPEVFQRYMTLI
ncbi:MAG TPA: type IV pilus twitching motility protein PilT [Anaerovoracaceae bacterium]|nr:type IV pilus twitching motility protein PilT [Anaerovoracaceae bacterium]